MSSRATKQDPGGLPLGTLEYLTFSRFYNAPGGTFQATLHLKSGSGTLPAGTASLNVPAGWSVDAGVTAGQPGSPPPYFAVGHFLFDTADAFYEVFVPVADQLLGDVPNYYDGGPPQVIESQLAGQQ